MAYNLFVNGKSVYLPQGSLHEMLDSSEAAMRATGA